MLKHLSVAFLIVLLGFCVGCGPKSQTPVRLSGTVTYKGNPLHGGNITFHTDNHGMLNTTINSDGTYKIDLPTGSMKVTVETESFNPEKFSPVYGPATAGGQKAGPGGGEAAQKGKRASMEGKGGGGGGGGGGSSFGPPPKEELAKLYTKIPAKYKFKETSGLSVQLETTGKEVRDFDLTD